jgi:hypothetical protein
MELNRQDAKKIREWKIRKISHKDAQEAQEGTERFTRRRGDRGEGK